MNTAQIANLLRPGVADVFGDYPMYPSQWKEIFEVYESDKNLEQEVEMKFTGLGQLRPEGSPTAVDTMGQRYVTTYFHKYVALQFAITRQALKDNLYKSRFPMMIKALKRSMAQSKELLGAAVLNNGDNTAYPVGDGQALFSLNHPIDNGVYANRPAQYVDLSEAALESAIIAIQQFKDQAGLTIQTKPKKLIVPPTGQFTACRLLESAFRTSTANNDISAIYNMSAIPEGYKVNQFLTLNNSWFVLTDADSGFKHYIREPIETDIYSDFATQNLLVSAVERYSFGVSNPRAAYGSYGP